ncbi:Hypothetical protein NTJ_02026 [Nesidiocoris tenuis]|uniref:Uncharacterized protein n=1 Tax=Nesidiocoris tenuis TaxID=355587 RepID=A0ABN7ADG9_9HEMI|nr:Hypothetical protein NTJ_02026 [Nesidiocoris tenuis]
MSDLDLRRRASSLGRRLPAVRWTRAATRVDTNLSGYCRVGGPRDKSRFLPVTMTAVPRRPVRRAGSWSHCRLLCISEATGERQRPLSPGRDIRLQTMINLSFPS